MYSLPDTAEAVGCPIRRSPDQSLLAAPRGLSQRATSFIASQCQGIHQTPLSRFVSAVRREQPAPRSCSEYVDLIGVRYVEDVVTQEPNIRSKLSLQLNAQL